MRPLKLSLTGFRSYPTPVTVEFTGKSLAAALGDTGAGKSSLLDAITFALFRKSSWDAKEPRQLIADGAQAMSVELTFLQDGQRWHVHRTMHATNPNAARHYLKNLDSGEEHDNAAKVDTRIKTLLQMGYDTFLRVGLLPQGKFDQLLTATPKERTARLRELFGAESLDAVQQLAVRHCLTLKGLIGDARTKRAAMPDNPRQAAATAGELAAVADARAGYLNTAVDRITALQAEAADARSAGTAADAAIRTLSARAVTEANTILNKVEPIAVGIVTRRDTLDRRAVEAVRTEKELRAEIAAADDSGEGLHVLDKAAVILETLAARAEEQRGERDRLAVVNRRLAAEGTAIAAAEANLATRTDDTQPLTQAASNAREASERIRTRAAAVRSLVTAVITAARDVADAANAQAIAAANRKSARESVDTLTSETLAAEERARDTEAHLETLRLRDKAAGIAAELHPGDDCPLCRRATPAGFTPESETSAAELRRVNAQRRDAKAAYDEATRRLANAHAAVTAAVRAVSESDKNYQGAELGSREAQAKAAGAFVDFAALAAAAGGYFEVESATTMLTATVTALATPDADGADHPEAITEAITACEQAAAVIADQKQTEALGHTTRLDAEREVLEGRKGSHRRSLKDAAAASERYTRAADRLAAEVRALPIRVQAVLPDEAINVGADAADVAAAAVAARMAEIQKLFDALEAARSEKSAVLVQQRALDQESHTAVEEPLYKLRVALDDWAQAATQAITQLGTTGQHEVPKTPTEPGITEIRLFAAELSEIATTLGHRLNEASADSAARADAALSHLRERAAELTDVDGFDPTSDLTAPQVLHPLVAAAAKAAKEAEDQREQQHIARELIRPAADLDTAIAAGEARLEALDVLRRELVNAKFLGHLTVLRTRALLGVASDLFGQLTDERFGFADGFDIVSRGSGVVHHPNRLSGGEKFLASLALALSLAELHSRSGPRLGSLFLDEGFAALDTATLESALEMLRTQTGGDRLVMVISHLHAVAEAVDDVLWVEHGLSGSTARWLAPAERDELVQADLASGLQSLA